jgi:hypothetical protein
MALKEKASDLGLFGGTSRVERHNIKLKGTGTMSFDLPARVERDLERYAQDEHISTAEAAIKLIRDGLKARDRGAKIVAPITDDELKQFEEAFPTLGLLDDVTDEQWNRILKTKQRLNKQGFPLRA